MSGPGKILVIRGGAIGDFILTLPAIGLLRENFPDCHLEILGYRQICSLAEGRYYADATRSIEYGPMAGFFNPKASRDTELSSYFAGFNQVISYLFDPDEVFASCLREAGVRHLITGSPKILDTQHAAHQLAEPLQKLALFLDDPAAHFHPTESDLAHAGEVLGTTGAPLIAVHPGSGGAAKNWPLESWIEFLETLLTQKTARILVTGGESDGPRLQRLRELFGNRITFLENLPLTTLGAVLSRSSLFVGHDSGISHLAAAAGAPCVLLFGPTDPQIWAPQNVGVQVIQAPGGALDALEVRDVVAKADDVLSHA